MPLVNFDPEAGRVSVRDKADQSKIWRKDMKNVELD